jgi:hypothetical protein
MAEPWEPLLPPDPEGELIHTREYQVKVYKRDESTLLVRGAVRDSKEPGLYIVGDPDPLTVHHMVVGLVVAFPSLEITDVEVEFESHPNPQCPSIADHYKGLIGLSVARGFTHKVRELFGGPRGCTHTTALLLAMGPAVVQSRFSMQVLSARERGIDPDRGFGGLAEMPIEERRKFWTFNLNTCHVWAEDGTFVADLEAGRGGRHVPVFVKRRLERLGRDGDSWRSPMQG